MAGHIYANGSNSTTPGYDDADVKREARGAGVPPPHLRVTLLGLQFTPRPNARHIFQLHIMRHVLVLSFATLLRNNDTICMTPGTVSNQGFRRLASASVVLTEEWKLH